MIGEHNREHGCHSSICPPRSPTYIAQDGYFNEKSKARIPNNIVVEDRMTVECQYRKQPSAKDDPRCEGCIK